MECSPFSPARFYSSIGLPEAPAAVAQAVYIERRAEKNLLSLPLRQLETEKENLMNAVTGAFGYTGKYITRRLLMLGESVLTLTGHPGRSNEFGASVKAFPFRFDDPVAMAESLSGVRVLYNTYWIRFDHGATTYDRAVANTRALIRAAEIAGVKRVVHISITNPDPESPLPIFEVRHSWKRKFGKHVSAMPSCARQ